jgi:hypothetical protein
LHEFKRACMILTICVLEDLNKINDDESLIESMCVSDITFDEIEFTLLRNEIAKKTSSSVDHLFQLFMTIILSMSFDERSSHIHIARMIFSTLFSTNKVFFNSSRMRTMMLTNYNQHLLRYRDERFAHHC